MLNSNLNNKIKALVVDDSAFMRKVISLMLESDTGIKVLGAARDGEEGYELAKALHPDIITLDIEMPIMDGLSALKKIMKDCPTSVIMLSSLTTEGAVETIKAMEYGAVDFIPKDLSFSNAGIVKIKDDLISRVKEIVKQRTLRERLARLRKLNGLHNKTNVRPKSSSCELPDIGYRAVGLGISTGGPFTLQKVIPQITGKINCPMFIVQHMPPIFTKSLAERLNGISKLEVKEAEDGESVQNGVVYIAPGGQHMSLTKISSVPF